MKNVSTKWGNEMGRVCLEVGKSGDISEEVTFNKLFLQDPKFLSMVVNDRVLMRVTVDHIGANRGGKEVWEEVS